MVGPLDLRDEASLAVLVYEIPPAGPEKLRNELHGTERLITPGSGGLHHCPRGPSREFTPPYVSQPTSPGTVVPRQNRIVLTQEPQEIVRSLRTRKNVAGRRP